jgi:hypothetical protein
MRERVVGVVAATAVVAALLAACATTTELEVVAQRVLPLYEQARKQ